MSAIQFLYFDLGNVLLHFSHERGCERLAQSCDRSVDQVREVVYDSGLQLQYEEGQLNDEEFCSVIRGHLGTSLENATILETLSDIFWVNPGMLPVIAHLRAAGFRLGILSNTCSAHWQFVTNMRHSFLRTCFDVHLLSFEVKSLKPQPSIYEIAERRAAAPGHAIFFTDDRAENVEGATAAGWQAVPFHNVSQIIGELWDRGIRTNL